MNGVTQFTEAIFDWTWRSSLYASVLILLVFLVQFAFGKVLPARWRYMLGLLVLFRLVLPVAPESKWSIFNLSKYFASSGPPSNVLAVPQGEAPRAGVSALSEVASSVAGEGGKPIDWMTAAQVAWLLGLAGSLLMAGWQHRRFASWVKGLLAVADNQVGSLLRDCKVTMNVRREIVVVSAPGLGTPALFGFCKPCLLLPEGTLGRLDDRELRMVFLHELAHVRRGDILLNWAVILVRSLHWFNPLVWLALKRLRADRELVCDAMVMSHLGADERGAYGSTLIRLLDDFSGAGFCPSLVPVINNKSEIKRRVTMIAKFKSPGRAAVLASTAVVVALCGFTFTRAADKAGNSQKEKAATFDPYFTKMETGKTTHIEYMKQKLEVLDSRISHTQELVDELREKLRVPGRVAEGRSESSFDPESIRRLEAERINVQAVHSGHAELLSKLKGLRELGGDDLKRAAVTATGDAQLAKLLEDLWSAEVTLASKRQLLGPENNEFKAVAAMQAALNDKVNDRIDGILSGLELKTAATKAQLDSLQRAIENAAMEDAEGSAKYRPYLQAKRDLESLQRVRDSLFMKILEQEYDVDSRRSEGSKQ
jgi:beta-lactamase regulating signal transducer with metallopeptidase domain